ncbi:unnamed protein product, partial [Owenia fusiformis]
EIKTYSNNSNIDLDFEKLRLSNADYFTSCPKLLATLLLSISGVPMDYTFKSSNVPDPDQDRNMAYKMCKTVESILNLTYLNSVLPIHFRESVLLYSLTGSKIALTVLNRTGPYASYDRVRKWLTNLGQNTIEIVDQQTQGNDTSILMAFDNNQVLKKTWSISTKKKFNASVVTMIVSFTIENEPLQNKPMFSPNQWKNKPLTDDKIQEIKNPDENPAFASIQNKSIKGFVEKRLKKIISEQKIRNGKMTDLIDDTIVENKYNKIFHDPCNKCGLEAIPKSKRVCPQCKQKITRQNDFNNAKDKSDKGACETKNNHTPKRTRENDSMKCEK